MVRTRCGAELDLRRKHGAENISRRREIVGRNPAAEFDEFWSERGFGIEKVRDGFNFRAAEKSGGVSVSVDYYADHRAIAERNCYARSRGRRVS